MCDEIREIIKSDCETVVIGGKSQIKNAMSEILKRRTDKIIRVIDDSEVDCSVALGVIRIYEEVI